MRAATSAAERNAAARPPSPVASPTRWTSTPGPRSGATRGRPRRTSSSTASGGSVEPTDDPRGERVGDQPEATGQAELGRQHGRRRRRASRRCPTAQVHGDRHRRLAAALDGHRARHGSAHREPAARTSASPGPQSAPAAHTTTSASIGPATGRRRWTLTPASSAAPISQSRRPARSGSARSASAQRAAEPVGGLPQLDAVAALGQAAGALQAGRSRRRRRRRAGTAVGPGGGHAPRARRRGSPSTPPARLRKIAPMQRYW